MSRIIKYPDPDDLIRRYVAGESIRKLAGEQGVSKHAIVGFMRRSGVLQDRSEFRLPLDNDAIVARYLAGESENVIANDLGVNRWTIRRRLLSAGVEPRNRSEAETLKWSQMTPKQRAAQVAAANDASRGRTPPRDRQIKQAQGRERTKAHAVAAEYELADLLRDRGYPSALQKAVDVYNIDIAIDSPPIAVEIFGGHWHASGDHERRFFKRTKYFLDSGWNIVIVWVDGRRYPVGVACAEYIVAFAQQLGRDIPARSQYRVIFGDGQDAPTADSYFNSPAVIERLRRC